MSKNILGGLVAVFFILVITSPAMAAGENEGGGEKFIEFLSNAGFIGWIIIALSVVVVGLWIEYAVSLKRARLLPEDLLDELSEPVDKGDRNEATRLCEESPCFFTNVVTAGLAHIHLGAIQAGRAMQDVREEETIKLFSRIGWLRLIADVAPMVGLLGTVWGMMRAVGEYTGSQSSTQTFASQGIRLALITTLLGLVVAIIATSVYFFFRNRVTRLSIEVGEEAEQMVHKIAHQVKAQ